MNLDSIWSQFLNHLTCYQEIEQAYQKIIVGIPFLYIHLSEEAESVDCLQLIRKASGKTMQGFRLHSETIFVRSEPQLLVYRHRFFVPAKKMFCCGNLCKDCIRFEVNEG